MRAGQESIALMSTLVQHLLTAARKFPQHTAIESGKDSVSYADFATRVISFATLFASLAPEPRIAICAHKNADTYAAMFAAMAAGGFYIPINPEAGANRIATVLAEIAPHAVFTEPSLVTKLAPFDERLRFLTSTDIPFHKGTVPDRKPHRLAYVMYTSGSTGRPKGVMISQAALDSYTRWAIATMQMTPDDRMSQHPNIGFDLSVLDIYATLCSGATLVTLDGKLDRLFPARAIQRHKLTVWNSVPSVMGMMQSSGDWKKADSSSLRLLTFCGEALLPQHLEGIFSMLPDVMVHNTYGPTEATVSCSLVRLTKQNYRQHCLKTVALGEPIPGTRFRIDGKALGELLIAGQQLADGYWGDEARSLASFVTLEDGKRYYRTGDYVEQLEQGLFFIERRDHQVKIKGHRVELGEISSKLREIAGAHAETIFDGQHLISFVEGSFTQPELDTIANAMKTTVESYMIPSQIVQLRNFPRNDNDKISLGELKQTWLSMKEGSQSDG